MKRMMRTAPLLLITLERLFFRGLLPVFAFFVTIPFPIPCI